MAVDIGGMRKSYFDSKTTFDLQDLVSKNPFDQFRHWFDQANSCDKIEEANAMCLATATKEGLPSARMVLLKEFGPEGFVFYSNYGSRKAGELQANPRAALMFYWEPLKRSVRIEGRVEKISEEKSIKYFNSRPFSSQVGAAVSEQSQVIANRQVLVDKETALKEEYKYGDGSKKLPKPENWGGYLVIPESFEFWQGQSNRIHDRLKFTPIEGSESEWSIKRLSP